MFFEEITIGQSYESPSGTVSKEAILQFGAMTGDNHPLHSDEEFSRSTQFGTIIAHGLYALSLMAGLKSKIDLYRDSSIASLGWDNVRFRRPITAGTRVRTVTTFIDKRSSSKPGQGIVRQAVKLLDDDGTELLTGEHVMLLRMKTVAAS